MRTCISVCLPSFLTQTYTYISDNKFDFQSFSNSRVSSVVLTGTYAYLLRISKVSIYLWFEMPKETPGPSQQKSQYSQKFRDVWLQDKRFQEWLVKVPGNDNKAYCRFCKTELVAKVFDLQNHLHTKRHRTAAEPFSSQRQTKLDTFVAPRRININCNRLEASLSLFVTTHCAIMNIDHLGVMCSELCGDSCAAKDLKLHRTKCSTMIKNLLAPHFQQDLLKDIGDGVYSLLLDESTDISVLKLLGVAIIYYSKTSKKVVSTFLGVVELKECTAVGIVSSLKEKLMAMKLNFKNLVGIGTDNASVMVGINNGVYTLLKKEIPHILLIRCVCHSLQLAVSHAVSGTLPRHLEFLCSETYGWFSKSYARQTSYAALYKTINDGHEPLKIVRACATRWLSIETAVSRLMEQWVELKTHFEVSRLNEKCYTAEMLYGMFSNDINLAYFQFLLPVLTELQYVNKAFQSNSSNPVKLLDDLTLLVKSVIKRVVMPSFNTENKELSSFDDFIDPKPYLGYQVEKTLENLRNQNKLDSANENMFRQKCKEFLIELAKQLLQRLPDNINLLKQISKLAVSNVLKANKEPIIPLLEERVMNLCPAEIEKIDNQYKKIHLLQWEKINDTVEFWSEVDSFRDASRLNPFKEIAELALKVLVFPWSNAEIERVFSQVNLIKNKQRNRMGLEMLESILTIRYGLRRHSKCCNTYKFPDEILQKVGTKGMYRPEESENCGVVDDILSEYLEEDN